MNTDWFIKFEEYLQGEMSSEEKSVFEAELSSNEDMKSAFHVYRSIESDMGMKEKHKGHEERLKNSLDQLNRKYFDASAQQPTKVVPIFSHAPFKAAIAIAASVVLILVAYVVFYQTAENPQNLADNYVRSHLKELSQTMDASPDSLQLGIAAYNNQEYQEALDYFEKIQEKQPDNFEAMKNIGLVYLVTQDYDRALQQFDELGQIENVYSNPAMFYKALTLLLRDQPGDREASQQLLEKVAREDAEGSTQAREWLKKF